MANLACGNSGLALVHALTSAVDVHLPHGYQNGVLLPHVAAFNRGAVAEAAVAEIDSLAALYDAIGFEARFADGEVQVKIDECARGMDVFLVQPTCAPVNETLM